MKEEIKGILTPGNGLTTGGLGAALSALVPVLAPDKDSLWRPVLYAAFPLVSAVIAYFLSWFVARFGFESAAEASLRNSLNRDLKTIDKELAREDIPKDFERKLRAQRQDTVLKLLSIGKTVKAKSEDI